MRYLIVLAEGSFMPSGRRTIADEEAERGGKAKAQKP